MQKMKMFYRMVLKIILQNQNVLNLAFIRLQQIHNLVLFISLINFQNSQILIRNFLEKGKKNHLKDFSWMNVSCQSIYVYSTPAKCYLK